MQGIIAPESLLLPASGKVRKGPCNPIAFALGRRRVGKGLVVPELHCLQLTELQGIRNLLMSCEVKAIGLVEEEIFTWKMKKYVCFDTK